MTRFLLPFVGAALLALAARAQTTYFPIPPANPNANSNRDRGPNGSVSIQRTAFIYTAADMAQGAVPANTTVNSLGFNIYTPAATVATGTFKVWVSTGVLDASFTRSTTWATLLTTPSPLTLVYDGPLTIPTTAGWFQIVFNQPGAGLLVQPGKGYYIAYEWTAITKSAASAAYSCFNRTNTLNTATTPTGTTPPSVLNNNSGFRPWIRLGASGGVSYPDAGVAQVYPLGQVPVLAGVAPAAQPALPAVVRARVYNGGTQVLRNLPVTLAITGPNPYGATITLDSLRPGDSTTVRFASFRPTVGGRHAVRVSVPAANDSIAANNAATDSLFVSAGRLTYAKGFPPGQDPYFTYPVGFASAPGALVVRHRVHYPAAVTHVGFSIGNFPGNVGRTVFALLLDSTGAPLTPLIPHVILPTELGEYVRVALPAPVRVRGIFFAGLGQPASTGAQGDFYPLGGQQELPITRDSAYYSIRGDLLLLGQTPPQEARRLGRLVVGVDLVPAPVGLPAEQAMAAGFVLWPNPARTNAHASVSVSVSGATPAAPVVLYDLTGRRVRATLANASGAALLDLRGLPAGVYAVRAGAVGGRLVVE